MKRKKPGAHLKPGTGRKVQVDLTRQEEVFCQHYVAMFPVDNATEAARRAQYSAKCAKAAANTLMKKPKIKERIKQLMGPVWARAQRKHLRTALTNQRLLEEAMAIASTDIRDVLEVKYGRVSVFDSEQWPDETAMAVESVSQNMQGDIKVKLHPKLEALKLLMLYQKMLGATAAPREDDPQIIEYHLPAKRAAEPLSLPAPSLASVHLPPKEQNGHAPTATRHPIILDDPAHASGPNGASGDGELD